MTGHDRGGGRDPRLAEPPVAAGDLPGHRGSRPVEDLVREKEVLDHLRNSLTEYNGRQQGSATRIGRVLLMAEPPSIDANEITDKGYINQGAALERRRLVERLYAERPDPGGDRPVTGRAGAARAIIP